jgi:hypothetical protein
MPGILDRSDAMIDTLKTTRRYGVEIESLDAATRAAALTDLVPVLEKCATLADYQAFNEKCRKWIDAHPRP